MATIVAGCVSAPLGGEAEQEARQTGKSVANGPGVIEETLSDSDLENPYGCRKETTTGTRVKRRTCKPPRDDTQLIPLISAPPE